jgi:membrane-associated phospholipid phosphatase
MRESRQLAGIALLLLVTITPLGKSQDAPPAPSNGTPTTQSPGVSPILAAGERPISWKQLIPNIIQDQKPIWLFPVHVAQGKHLKPTAGFILATAGLVTLDPHTAPYFRRTNSFADFNRTFSGERTAIGTALVPLAFYGVSLARKDTYGQRTALYIAEAVADAEILTTVMKNVDRRLRPSDIPPYGDYSHTWFKGTGTVLRGRGGFPSGHTIAAFSVATVFADRYRKHRWVPYVAYGLAGWVGFTRVSLQSHFVSDVFAGAALGYVIAHNVTLRQP